MRSGAFLGVEVPVDSLHQSRAQGVDAPQQVHVSPQVDAQCVDAHAGLGALVAACLGCLCGAAVLLWVLA